MKKSQALPKGRESRAGADSPEREELRLLRSQHLEKGLGSIYLLVCMEACGEGYQ